MQWGVAVGRGCGEVKTQRSNDQREARNAIDPQLALRDTCNGGHVAGNVQPVRIDFGCQCVAARDHAERLVAVAQGQATRRYRRRYRHRQRHRLHLLQ